VLLEKYINILITLKDDALGLNHSLSFS